MPSALQTLPLVTVYDYVYDPTTGLPLSGVPVTVTLNTLGVTAVPSAGGAASVYVAPKSYSATTDANGYWSVSLVPTNQMGLTGVRYTVSDGFQQYSINPIQAGIPAAGWQSNAIRTSAPVVLPPSVQTVGALTTTGLLTAQAGITVPSGGGATNLQSLNVSGSTSAQAISATAVFNRIPYKVRAHQNSVQAIGAGAGYYLVKLDTVDYDPNGNFDPLASRWTCPRAGYYLAQFRTGVTTAAQNSRLEAVLRKNGADIAYGSEAAGDTSQVLSSGGDILSLAAGDYLELWGYWNGAGVNSLSGASSILAVHYLSE